MVDPQLKRGLLDACVLSLLRRGDSYGYQLIKDISPYIDVSESTLYPILRRLGAAGGLAGYSGGDNGRPRRVFRDPGGGLKQIDAFLEGWTEIQRVYEFVKECAGDDAERVSQ